MKIIKRDGKIVDYDPEKIRIAIGKANDEVSRKNKATKEQIFNNPCHPYTKGLLNAIPLPNLKKRGKLKVLKGEVSSPINPKPGCRFAVRCPYATEKCMTGDIPLKEIEKDHFVACTLFD